MDSETVERVTEWDSEPFSEGYAGLRELADGEFTGAVTEGGSWLFILNGRVLGVFDGDMDRFEGADGTAYAAPDRSLPLLFAMREAGGEVRGEYYSEETPLSEVDRTLQSGNFTGYVELSENVLSGDYYLAYYGGRRMPVAFIGNQRRRVTGDEAFERADDEVGIYRVRTVDLDIADVPEPEPAAGSAGSGTAAGAGTPSSNGETATSSDYSTAAGSADDEGTDTEPVDDGRTEPTRVENAARSETAGRDSGAGATTATAEPAEPTAESGSEGGTEDEPTTASAAGGETSRSATQAAEPSTTGGEANSDGSTSSEPASDATAAGSPSAAESDWQGTTTIPALDPARSVSMESGDGGDAAAQPEAESEPESRGVPPEEVEALREERDRLQGRVEELEAENERLTGERDRLERERDEAAATAEELEDELAELRATVEELEAELEAAEAELDAAREYVPEGDHELPAEEAIAGTSLFVRYERKGGPTLEDAHNGDAGREAVNDNLRLEHHTEFEDEGAIVDGDPFDEWLRGTIEYGFVEWLTRAFVHDVRETRNQTSMGKLYDAVPDVDRVEFRGTVDLGAEAEEESASFDVVLRDRMGQPLVVTDLNDSRDPATEPMLESLIRNATPVGETNERLSAAFFVTSSYYEPGALETAEESTGSGFLSRGKNKSFVKLSRKDGYHLCLVETRDGEFHVSVPEL
jgi:hypothetical protein